MNLLRAIIVFISCLCFSTVAMAGSAVRCCEVIAALQADDAKAAAYEAEEASQMPCHQANEASAAQDKAASGDASQLSAGADCQCLGTVQLSQLPSPSAPKQVAFNAAFGGFSSPIPLGIPSSIENPPKHLS